VNSPDRPAARHRRQVVAAVALILAVGACSPAASSSPPAESQAPASATAAAPRDSAAPSQQSAEGLKLAALAHLRIPYTQQITDAAKFAADEVGADLQVAGPEGVDQQAHIKAFNDSIAAGAEGVMTVAFLPDIWVRPIDDATDGGTLVYTFDIASPDSKEAVHVGPSNIDLGRSVAGAVVDDLGADATGDVIVGICVPGNPVLETRVQAFNDGLAELAPGLTPAAAVDVTADPTENLSTWQQLIQTNPDAKAFVGFCAFDLANLVKIKERTPDAAYGIYGTDLEPDTLRGIKEGIATQTFGQKPFMEGYIASTLMIDSLTGGPQYAGWVDVGVEKVDSSNIDPVIAREEAATNGDWATVKAAYQSEIDAILAAGEGGLKPLSELAGP
jgi:ABC-type sugar transport system substrate-binding protein